MADILTSPSACIQADPDQIAKVMLLPGDPLRAKTLAERYFTDVVCFNTVRNMLGFTGTYRGRRISVMGSGMGIPSATLYAHELFTLFGVEALIRIGSAGGLQSRVRPRDLVLAMTASTNSRFCDQYRFPGLLAPQADFGLLQRAAQAAQERNITVHAGSVYTTDMFYTANPEADLRCRDMGMLAIEMETAGLYWEAMACQKRALSILTVSNHLFTGEELSVEERQNGFDNMMEVALETAWSEAE